MPAEAARATPSRAAAKTTAVRLLCFSRIFLPCRTENTSISCQCKRKSPIALFGAVPKVIKLTHRPISAAKMMQTDQTTVTLSRPGSKPHEQIDIVIPNTLGSVRLLNQIGQGGMGI